MDLDHLLRRHRIPSMRADAVRSAVVRDMHRGFAAAYAMRSNKAAEPCGAGMVPPDSAR